MIILSSTANTINIIDIPNFRIMYTYNLGNPSCGYHLFPMKINNGSYHSYLIVFYPSSWKILLDGNEVANGTLNPEITTAVVDAYWKVSSYPNYTLYLTFYLQDLASQSYSLEL